MVELPSNIIESCTKVLQQVGAFQLQYFRSLPEHVGDAKAVREMVSFVDVESEKMLAEGLLPLLENVGFYGEESGKSGSQEMVWIVDPLDGTTNYLSGIDHFSISVALVRDEQPLLGLVYKPISGEMYSCVKGQGTHFNGQPQQPANPEVALSEALFVTGFPYRSHDVAEQFFKAAAEILTLGRGIRRSGSAALDIANLSLGWYQGFWETDLQPYDVAAGVLFMQENGLKVTNHKGEPYDMFHDRLMVAAFPKVHEGLLKAVAKHYVL